MTVVPVGLVDMLLTPWVSRNGQLFVAMHCAGCGRCVCLYRATDLDEMCAEYGAHLARYH